MYLYLLHMSHTAFVLHIPPNREVMEIMRTLEMLRSFPEGLNLFRISPPLLLAHHVFFSTFVKILALPEWIGGIRLRVGRRLVLGSEGFKKATVGLRRDEKVGGEEIGVFPTITRPGCMSAYHRYDNRLLREDTCIRALNEFCTLC